eukprot:scaffold1170_cov174-Amphora_coffeaeformis.AAC.1
MNIACRKNYLRKSLGDEYYNPHPPFLFPWTQWFCVLCVHAACCILLLFVALLALSFFTHLGGKFCSHPERNS